MGRIAKTCKVATVEAAIEKLAAMPEKPKAEASMKTSDAITQLKPVIRQMQNKGYTLDEILVAVRDSGIDVGLTTLKSAVAKTKRKTKVTHESSHAPALVTKVPQALVTKTATAPAFQDPDEK